MHIENLPQISAEELSVMVLEMSDSELIAQEITQQAAIHAIRNLKQFGVSEQHADQMLHSLSTMGEIVSSECNRRGTPKVRQPPAPDAPPLPMNQEEYNRLLAGPLKHQLAPVVVSRLIGALFCVVRATGPKGAEALREHCRALEVSEGHGHGQEH